MEHLTSLVMGNPTANGADEIAPAGRAVAYIRVSRNRQADRGMGIKAQEALLRAHALAHGLDIVSSGVDDGASAKSMNRPALGFALAMLRSGDADVLLVAKLDRLTRSTRGLGQLVEEYFADPDGPALLSVAEDIDTRSAEGRHILSVVGTLSRWEDEAIRERISATMRRRASRGAYGGGRVPFGYRVEGGHLVADVDEQRVRQAARAARATGLSLRAIAARLERAGHRARSGRAFAPVQIARMLAA